MTRVYKTDGGSIWMDRAKQFALRHSLDLKQKVGCVIVNVDVANGGSALVIGSGANGSAYHETHGCVRKQLGCKSGEGYELCEGCHPKNHAEPSAIHDALTHRNGGLLRNASLYMWGHWWCCDACWAALDAVGISDVYLVPDAQERFR